MVLKIGYEKLNSGIDTFKNIFTRFKKKYPPNQKDKFIRYNSKKQLEISTIPYVIKKNRPNGESDLIELCNSNQEGAWIYSSNKEEWHNLTLDFISKNEKGIIIGAKFMNFDYSTIGDKITHYHTHPKLGFNYQKESIYHNIIDQSVEEELKEEFAYKLSTLHCILPSTIDIQTALEIYQTSMKKHKNIDFKIISEYGITTTKIQDLNKPKNKILKEYEHNKELSLFTAGSLISFTDFYETTKILFELLNTNQDISFKFKIHSKTIKKFE